MMLHIEGADNYQFMAKSTVPVAEGEKVFMDIEPENIHIMKKSGIETLTMQKHRFLHDPNATKEDAPDE